VGKLAFGEDGETADFAAPSNAWAVSSFALAATVALLTGFRHPGWRATLRQRLGL
jgi:hypothetical protein